MTPPRAPVRAEPNVTPMIDVMLVLLIIFMAVGPLLEAGFPAIPPDARFATRHPDDAAEATIGLDAQGMLYLNKVAVDSAGLRSGLQARFHARPDDHVVFLRADHSLPYARVQSTMELAAGAGATMVGLVSVEPVARLPRE